jgi:hypothetical protein
MNFDVVAWNMWTAFFGSEWRQMMDCSKDTDEA